MKKVFVLCVLLSMAIPVLAETRYVTNQTPTSNYYTYQNTTPVNNTTGKWKAILDNVSNAFFGCPTGMTPPINPYNSYGSNGYNSNYGSYQDYYGNNGWSRQNSGIGSGTGIHIID